MPQGFPQDLSPAVRDVDSVIAAMRQTEYGRERMRLVIEHRSSHSLPTVITCDRPLEAVDSAGQEVVEVRLASRIAKRSSAGKSFVFEIDHETDRRTGA